MKLLRLLRHVKLPYNTSYRRYQAPPFQPSPSASSLATKCTAESDERLARRKNANPTKAPGPSPFFHPRTPVPAMVHVEVMRCISAR